MSMNVQHTIVVVEDDDANAMLVDAVLTRLGGYRVDCTEAGDVVLAAVAEGDVVAVVMDVSLRDTRVDETKVDGIELTRRIRDLPRGRDLPVILLTAHAMKGDRERLLFSSGANDYVAKPIVDHVGFVDLVRRHIEASGVLRRLEHEAAGRRSGDS